MKIASTPWRACGRLAMGPVLRTPPIVRNQSQGKMNSLGTLGEAGQEGHWNESIPRELGVVDGLPESSAETLGKLRYVGTRKVPFLRREQAGGKREGTFRLERLR